MCAGVARVAETASSLGTYRGNRVPEDTGRECAVALGILAIAEGKKVLPSFEFRVMQPFAFAVIGYLPGTMRLLAGTR